MGLTENTAATMRLEALLARLIEILEIVYAKELAK